jgi:hypothetical protein
LRDLESVNDLVGTGHLAVLLEYTKILQRREPGRIVETFFSTRREIELQQ